MPTSLNTMLLSSCNVGQFVQVQTNLELYQSSMNEDDNGNPMCTPMNSRNIMRTPFSDISNG